MRKTTCKKCNNEFEYDDSYVLKCGQAVCSKNTVTRGIPEYCPDCLKDLKEE